VKSEKNNHTFLLRVSRLPSHSFHPQLKNPPSSPFVKGGTSIRSPPHPFFVIPDISNRESILVTFRMEPPLPTWEMADGATLFAPSTPHPLRLTSCVA
jgi:hypothetical protein